MNILIIGDSRTYRWPERLQENYPNHNFSIVRFTFKVQRSSLYHAYARLQTMADNSFDIIFVQTGYHENITFMPPDFFKEFIGPTFNISNLTNDQGDNHYNYNDPSTETAIFSCFKQKGKKVVYIGFPILKNFGSANSEKARCEIPAQNINKHYAALATDYIELPQTEEEHLKLHTWDGLHLNTEGQTFVYQQCERFLK